MAEPGDTDEEVLWLGVLDELVAGRGTDLSCPFCGNRPLTIRRDGQNTKVACTACHRFIEGRLG